MPYAYRVQLRDEAGDLQADTDPDAPHGAPGAEQADSMSAVHAAVIGLCQAFHEGAELAWRDMALDHLGDTVRGYIQPYAVSHGHGFEVWAAHVDIIVV